MIPIKKLGFKTLKELGTAHLDQDMLDLCLCIRQGFGRENQDIWYRETSHAFELAVCDGMTLNRQAITSLITCDEILNKLRSRDFAVGEIKPDVANFTLISIFKTISR